MAAPWYRSKLFLIVAAVVVLVVVGLLVAPYLLDLDRYRPLIVAQLEQATGRKVEIDSLRLHFLPSVRVVVSGVHVKNPADFPVGDTLAVGEVDIGLALAPLLRRQVEITSVSVEGVELNLLANEIGQTNYDSLLKPPRRSAEAKSAPAPVSLGQVDSVALEGIKVSSGSFWRQDKRVHPGWTLTGLNLEASGFDFREKAWLANVEAAVDLSTIEVASPALTQPLRFTDGKLGVSSNIAEGDFQLALGSLRGGGTVKVTDVARLSAVEFTLAIPEVNLAELGALLSSKAQAGPRPPAGGSSLLARGSVQVDRVLAAPLTAQKVNAKARLYTNRLEIDPFTLNLYGGRTQGTLGIDLASQAMTTRLHARVDGVDVGKFVTAVAPQSKKKITGTLEADARLGVPLSAPDPLAALSGEGTFAVRDGTFPGLDLGGTLMQMAKFMQISLPAGDTRFSYFGGDLQVSNQRVHSRELKLTGEALDATLHGSVGLDQTLSYTGTGMLKGQGSAQAQPTDNPVTGLRRIFGKVAQTAMNITGMRVPFSVGGTLQDPKFSLAGAPQPVR